MTREQAVEDLKILKAYFEKENGVFPVCLEYAINELSKEVEENNEHTD